VPPDSFALGNQAFIAASDEWPAGTTVTLPPGWTEGTDPSIGRYLLLASTEAGASTFVFHFPTGSAATTFNPVWIGQGQNSVPVYAPEPLMIESA
jgi:hypothetical protein